MLHVIQIVLKGKHRSQWFDLKTQFVDANKIRDFFTMNSNLRIRFHELKIHSYEFVRVFSMLCCEWPVLYDDNKIMKRGIWVTIMKAQQHFPCLWLWQSPSLPIPCIFQNAHQKDTDSLLFKN